MNDLNRHALNQMNLWNRNTPPGGKTAEPAAGRGERSGALQFLQRGQIMPDAKLPGCGGADKGTEG
jgi:hypothetical protein